MKFVQTILLLSFVVCLAGCSGSKNIKSSWRTGNSSRPYTKILVVGIIKDTSTSLRKEIETSFVNDLKNMGQNAVSAMSEFGEEGLKGLEQEQTYIMLCNRGIDAIITLALLDRTKEKFYVPARVKYYSNLYYYNRIWNYNMIQADLNSGKQNQYAWEAIVFDLQALSPVYAIQTRSFDTVSLSSTYAYEQIILANMIRKKVLAKINNKPALPKTF